jgi:hypothetical protein
VTRSLFDTKKAGLKGPTRVDGTSGGWVRDHFRLICLVGFVVFAIIVVALLSAMIFKMDHPKVLLIVQKTV